MTKSHAIKLGIIGTGSIANRHAQLFNQVRGVRLTACMDLDTQRARDFADKHGVTHVCDQLDDLFNEADAVTITTTDPSHVPLVIQSIRAGRHVLCEKPLATSLPEARKAVRELDCAGKRADKLIHMINFSYRNAPVFDYAAKLVADGKLGEIRHVHSRYLQHWLTSNQWGPWHKEPWLWRLQSTAGSGGTLYDIGVHMLDLITAVAGDLNGVGCRLYNFPKIHPDSAKPIKRFAGKSLDANDTALIELAFQNGAVGQAQTTRWATGHANHVALEVHGTEGALAIDLDAGYDQVRTCLGKARHKGQWSTRKLRPVPNLQQRFIKAIRIGENPQPDLVRGAQVQAYLDACERSAKQNGKLLPIRSWR